MPTFRERIAVEEIDECLFRGTHLWKPANGRSVFGGQVVAQALHAAMRTTDVHKVVPASFHCYFILPGDAAVPILYHVERVRDGRSFAIRAVTASQRDKQILRALVNFQQVDSAAFSAVQHAYAPPPGIPEPEAVPTLKARVQAVLADERLPDSFRPRVEAQLHDDNPLDVRYCRKSDPLDAQPDIPRQCIWVRANELDDGTVPDAGPFPLSVEARVWHYCAAAFASDFALLGTALLPHRSPNPGVSFMASLDHTIWFHGPLRATDWLLYEIEAPSLVRGRGFAVGHIYRRDGTLAMSTAQEGAIRFLRDWSPEPPLQVVRRVGSPGLVWTLVPEGEASGAHAESPSTARGMVTQPSPTWGSIPPALEQDVVAVTAGRHAEAKL